MLFTGKAPRGYEANIRKVKAHKFSGKGPKRPALRGSGAGGRVVGMLCEERVWQTVSFSGSDFGVFWLRNGATSGRRAVREIDRSDPAHLGLSCVRVEEERML